MFSGERLSQQVTNLNKERTAVSFALVKPDGFKRLVMNEFEDNLTEQGLKVVTAFPVQLDRDSIVGIFPHLLEPSEFGDDWKTDVIEALQEGPAIAYAITGGENPVDDVLNIKRRLRNKHTDRTDYAQRVVKNLFHSADTVEESRDSLKIALDKLDYRSGIDSFVRYTYDSTSRGEGYEHVKKVSETAVDILSSTKLDEDLETDVIYAAGMMHDIGKAVGKDDTDFRETEQVIDRLSWLPEESKDEAFIYIFDAGSKPAVTNGGRVLSDAHTVTDVFDNKAVKEELALHYSYSKKLLKN